MDVSTSICDDPKFRRIQRQAPHLVAPAFLVYISVMAESWKTGRRVSIEDAWPTIVPYDPAVDELLREVGLLDRRGQPTPKAWRGWFEPARERRDKARDRWARYNAKRDADTTPPPRGSDVGTATSVPLLPSVPSEPSVRPSAPSARARGEKDDGLKPEEERRRALHALSDAFKRGEMTEIDYERQRRDLAS